MPEDLQRVTDATTFRLNPVQWIGGDGKKLYDVSTMQSTHIHNCVQMIETGRMKRKFTNGLHQAVWIEIFRNELAAREWKRKQKATREHPANPVPPGAPR